jgi:hypothetical protein
VHHREISRTAARPIALVIRLAWHSHYQPARPGRQHVSRMYPNATSGDGFWCNFFLLEGEITDEGIFPMKSHGSFSHVIMRANGSVGSAPHAPATGTVRTWVKRGILVLALVLGSVGAAASVSQGHVSTGHVQATAHQRLPWMY